MDTELPSISVHLAPWQEVEDIRLEDALIRVLELNDEVRSESDCKAPPLLEDCLDTSWGSSESSDSDSQSSSMESVGASTPPRPPAPLMETRDFLVEALQETAVQPLPPCRASRALPYSAAKEKLAEVLPIMLPTRPVPSFRNQKASALSMFGELPALPSQKNERRGPAPPSYFRSRSSSVACTQESLPVSTGCKDSFLPHLPSSDYRVSKRLPSK
eukprot:TRINITY_DN54739_c0_g1_i1.p1 TRINITY_DN54739_c0_g1~~TRINITY_DN54739_c0_g1_i1.p1  ORF type:complete len:245 (+),score=34.72 TRINITY_DN54739_c0_g1_i1:88-735(+)